MAVITYPLNGVMYSAENAETYLCTRTSGVFSSDGHFSAAVTADRQVTISKGLAWINNTDFAGKSVCNTANVVVDIPYADGALSRIDRIVLRFDKAANASTIALKQGEAAAQPTAPDLERTELIYELGLCTVSIPAASTVVSQADVTDTRRDETVCGLMRDGVTNIPTEDLQAQAESFIANLRASTEAVIADLSAYSDAIVRGLGSSSNRIISDLEASSKSTLEQLKTDSDAVVSDIEQDAEELTTYLRTETERLIKVLEDAIAGVETGADIMLASVYGGSEAGTVARSDEAAMAQKALRFTPASSTSLPASGTALEDNTIYTVAAPVGTYTFAPPATGWAHGIFTTGEEVAITVSGPLAPAAAESTKIINMAEGAAPLLLTWYYSDSYHYDADAQKYVLDDPTALELSTADNAAFKSAAAQMVQKYCAPSAAASVMYYLHDDCDFGIAVITVSATETIHTPQISGTKTVYEISASAASFLGAAPEFAAGATYEFSLLNGVWAFAEVTS